MRPSSQRFLRSGYYPVLLPLFFFLRGAKEAYGAVGAAPVLLHAAAYIGLAVLLIFVFSRIFRRTGLAPAAVAGILLGLLYWGDIVYGLQDRFAGTYFAKLIPLVLLLAAGGAAA